MCGIAGFTRPEPDARNLLQRMSTELVHRGPDEAGTYLDDDAGLAIRRLSIVDVKGGHQPYRNEARDVIAVFNGELYRFEALRRALESRGHRFETRADGEVIVHAYEEYGDDFVRHIDGMFAVALWDARRRRLVLARDRLGKKPLYFARWAHAGVSFASELRAILQDPRVDRSVHPESIARYLRLGYVPAPDTAFRGISKLRPGHMLTCDHAGALRERCYWTLSYEPKLDLTYAEAVSEFDQRVSGAVQARLLSDVPLGAFLSGGRDSSYVVAHLASLTAHPVRTFCIGFEHAGYDERPYAAKIANRLGTEHHEELVSPSDLRNVLPRLVRHYGEPFADSSAVPTFYLARLARHHITVALTGEGGDELVSGYDRHVAAKVAGVLDRLPQTALSLISRSGARIVPRTGDGKSRWDKFHRFLHSLPLDADERFMEWAGVLTATRQAALAPGLPEVAGPGLSFNARHVLDRALAYDTEHYLPNDLLTKSDISTMACSLESRAPLLDFELVEWAARLPATYKMHGTRRKRVLEDALAGRLPRDLFDRPKMGFAVPVGAWLRGELRELVKDALLGPTCRQRGYVNEHAVASLLREHGNGRADHSAAIWALLMLELWHQEIADRPGPGSVDQGAH